MKGVWGGGGGGGGGYQSGFAGDGGIEAFHFFNFKFMI